MEELRAWSAIVVIFGILGYGGIAGCQRISAKRSCLQAGYPQAEIDIMLNQYCIKRVDQTDIVIPLKDIKK